MCIHLRSFGFIAALAIAIPVLAAPQHRRPQRAEHPRHEHDRVPPAAPVVPAAAPLGSAQKPTAATPSPQQQETPATPEPNATQESLGSTAPVPPQVSFSGGLLTISASNSTLADVLNAVKTQTGAKLEIPAGAAQQRVAVQLGPGNPRDVLSQLLDGSPFDYILLGSAEQPNALTQIILTRHEGGGATAPQPGTPVASAPEPAEDESANEPPAEAQPPPAAPPMPPEPGQQPAPPAAANGQQTPANRIKTPEQLLQELQQMQRQEQQRQQQQQNRPPR